MANNIKGITIEIGGNTGPLDTALKGVNKTSRDLQSELKEVNKQLKLDPGNTVLLTQKQKLLAESIASTKSKLDTLKIAEGQAQDQFKKGKISEEQYRALQREVIKTEAQLKLLATQADKSNLTLSKVKLGAQGIADGASNIAGKMTPATIAIAALGAGAVKLGSDLIESTNKVDVAFGKNANEVKAWSDTTLKKFGIAKGSALEMSSLFGDMASGMGINTSEASKMSTTLGGLAGDLASFKNIGLDQAQNALKGIFTGEGESLKSLGVIMLDSTLAAFALSTGQKTAYKDMTQAEKVILRYQYVLDKTKNSQGDFARTSDGAANSMRIATESTKEASSTIGVMLAPVVAQVAQYIANLAKNFSGLSEGTKKTVLIIIGLIAIIAPLAGLISGIATIVGVVTTVIGVITAAIGLFTGTLLVAGPAATALAAAITFITGPIGLTILAVGALVIGFMYLWKNCEGFRNFWIGLWTSIKETTKVVVDALVVFFTVTIPQAWKSVVSFFTGIPAWFSNLWNETKTSTENIWNGIGAFFVNLWTSITNSITNVWNGIKTFFTTVWNGIVTAVMAIVRPFILGITNIFNSVKPGLEIIFNGLKLFFTGVWNAIKLIFLGPILLICDLVTGNFGKLKTDATKIFIGLQQAFAQIWAGIKAIFVGVVTAISGFLILQWNGIVNITKAVWNGLKAFMSALWTGIINTAIVVWNGFTGFMVALWDGIKNVAVAAWNGLKNLVINIISALVNGAISTFNGVLNFFRNLPGTLWSLGSNAFNGLKNGITYVLSTLGSAVANGFNSAISFIKGLPGQALGWGKDFVQGLIDGITSKVSAIGDAVAGVGNKIRGFLHFSVPDEGPLTDYESWMPDFMTGLAKGIENSKHLVASAVKGLSTDMNIGMSLSPAMAGIGSMGSQGNTNNSYGSILHTDNVTINNGMDIQTLAQELEFYRSKAAKSKGSE